MLYFTLQVFCCLANQIDGHIRVMLDSMFVNPIKVLGHLSNPL